MVIADADHEDLAWDAASTYDAHCGVVTLDVTSARSAGDRLSMRALIVGRQPDPCSQGGCRFAGHGHLHQRQHGSP